MAWIKIDAACAYAGGLSRKTLYGSVRRGELKAARVGCGRNIVFCEAFIDEWLESRSRIQGAEHIDRGRGFSTRAGAAA